MIRNHNFDGDDVDYSNLSMRLICRSFRSILLNGVDAIVPVIIMDSCNRLILMEFSVYFMIITDITSCFNEGRHAIVG